MLQRSPFWNNLHLMNRRALPTKLPVPTGDPWIPSPEDPATVPVPLPVIIVSVDGPYTERDRKLWTFLLQAMWDDLDKNAIHELRVQEINRVFRELGGEAIWNWRFAADESAVANP